MTKAQIDFINMIAPLAVAQAAKHNHQLFASVAIAQAAHESGWGTAPKMVNANALYGIKVGKSAWKFGTAWKGAAYKTGTTEYYDGKNPKRITDYFRAYDSVADATEDYFDMLCHCQRYKPALNRSTPAQSIVAIVAGGYATGPEYATKIISIINSCNLTVYDRQVYTPTTGLEYEIGHTYTTQQDLNVREEPDGEFLTYLDLTDDAKKHAFVGSSGNAILKRQTRVTVKEIKTIGACTWLRIPSGWICGKNSKNIFVM